MTFVVFVDVKVMDVKNSHGDIIEVANTSLKAFSAGSNVLVSENSIVHDASNAEREAAAEPGLRTFGASNDEGTACDNESTNKFTNSAPDASFVHDTPALQDKPQVENHDVSNEVGDVEPCLHSFGVSSVQCTSETASFQASPGGTVQNDSEWLVKPHEATSDASSFLASDGTQHDTLSYEKVDIAAAEPIVYTFCDETVHCTSKFIPQSLDAVSEYKLQASRCKPHDSGEGNIVSDKEGIKIGVASVEPNQHAFGDAPAVCTLYC